MEFCLFLRETFGFFIRLSIKGDKLVGHKILWPIIGVHSMKSWLFCRKLSHEINIFYLTRVIEDIEKVKCNMIKDDSLSRDEKASKIKMMEQMESQSIELLKSNRIKLYQLSK
jgi:hypothetical protein